MKTSHSTILFAALVLWGCVDPLDLVGVEQVVSESRKQEPLADDQLADKHPEYDAERTVVENFDGCDVTLNKSASVTKLTLQSKDSRDAALRGKIFRSRAAAQEALAGAPLLPSVEVVNGALKPFNDGLYAAVELAAEHGKASRVNKHQLLLDLLADLTQRAAQGAAAEREPAQAAARHVATALVLSGQADAVDASLLEGATEAANAFLQQGIFAKPIGFYDWTPALQTIFTRDRWLQSRYVPGDEGVPFAALAGLGWVASQGGPLAASYRDTLDLYAGLTDPFFDATPFDIAPFVPDAAALGDLTRVEQSFAASLPRDFADPRCNPGAAAFPASESAENRTLRLLLCGGELGEGESLIDGLIRKIQLGELDLTPRANAGFYDHQLYALETLLVLDKATESAHLLLTRAYKEKLVDSFKSLIIQTRETHVKQVAMVQARAALAELPNVEYTVYPKLLVEPLPTFYLRSARAYRFLEGVLNAALGTEFLQGTARLLEDGERAATTLAEELRDKQQLLYGLHAVAADSIGMAPEPLADELELFPLAEAREAARSWLAGAMNDPDVQRDPRVSLPVATETDARTGAQHAIYWAVVGVKVIHLHASYPETHRPEIVAAPHNCTLKGWASFEPYLLVEQSIQVRRPVDAPPLTREEFRALCDQHDTVDAITAAFESAP